VNRLDQETAKRRGPTRAVEPFKKMKKKKKKNDACCLIWMPGVIILKYILKK
jgi:hypothetical protein